LITYLFIAFMCVIFTFEDISSMYLAIASCHLTSSSIGESFSHAMNFFCFHPSLVINFDGNGGKYSWNHKVACVPSAVLVTNQLALLSAVYVAIIKLRHRRNVNRLCRLFAWDAPGLYWRDLSYVSRNCKNVCWLLGIFCCLIYILISLRLIWKKRNPHIVHNIVQIRVKDLFRVTRWKPLLLYMLIIINYCRCWHDHKCRPHLCLTCIKIMIGDSLIN